MEFNKTTYRMRNMRNLTRKETASITGISYTYYHALEGGDITPRPKMLLKVANGLNFPMDLFFKDEDKQYLVNSVIALILMTPDEELQNLVDNSELCKTLKHLDV